MADRDIEELDEKLKKLLVRLKTPKDEEQLPTLIQILQDLSFLAHTEHGKKLWFIYFFGCVCVKTTESNKTRIPLLCLHLIVVIRAVLSSYYIIYITLFTDCSADSPGDNELNLIWLFRNMLANIWFSTYNCGIAVFRVFRLVKPAQWPNLLQ